MFQILPKTIKRLTEWLKTGLTILHKETGIETTAGNHKVTRSLIFNMNPAHHCPSRSLGCCQLDNMKECYAFRDEYRYWRTCLPFRLRQEWQWNNKSVSQFVEAFRYGLNRTGFDSIRFNVSGDFRNKKDIEKLCAIAERMPDVVFFTYTARNDLWWQGCFANKPSNLIINGSGFMADNMFGPSEWISRNQTNECLGECGTCPLCKEGTGKIVFNAMH